MSEKRPKPAVYSRLLPIPGYWPIFVTIALDIKTGVNCRKSSISTVCKGSIRVSYGVCTVSVRRRCMAVPLRTARVNDGGFKDNRDATTVWRNNCSGPGTIILKVIFLCVNARNIPC